MVVARAGVVAAVIAARAVGLDGGRDGDPRGNVQGMDELFGNRVARKNAVQPPARILLSGLLGS